MIHITNDDPFGFESTLEREGEGKGVAQQNGIVGIRMEEEEVILNQYFGSSQSSFLPTWALEGTQDEANPTSIRTSSSTSSSIRKRSNSTSSIASSIDSVPSLSDSQNSIESSEEELKGEESSEEDEGETTIRDWNLGFQREIQRESESDVLQGNKVRDLKDGKEMSHVNKKRCWRKVGTNESSSKKIEEILKSSPFKNTTISLHEFQSMELEIKERNQSSNHNQTEESQSISLPQSFQSISGNNVHAGKPSGGRSRFVDELVGE